MNNSKKVKRTKKAVIYTRASTEEQAGRGTSLVDHEEMVRKVCEYEGIEIVDHIQDDGCSAKTFNRPAFQHFFANLKSARIKIDFLYIVRWDRFSRNMKNTYLMEYELEKYGVEVRCLEDSYDTSDPTSIMFRGSK